MNSNKHRSRYAAYCLLVKYFLRTSFFCTIALSLGIFLRINKRLAQAQDLGSEMIFQVNQLNEQQFERSKATTHYSQLVINQEVFKQEHSFDSLLTPAWQLENEAACHAQEGLFRSEPLGVTASTKSSHMSFSFCVFLVDSRGNVLKPSELLLSPTRWLNEWGIQFKSHQARPVKGGNRITLTQGTLTPQMLMPDAQGNTPGTDLASLPRPEGQRLLSLGDDDGQVGALYQQPFTPQAAKLLYQQQLGAQCIHHVIDSPLGLVIPPQVPREISFQPEDPVHQGKPLLRNQQATALTHQSCPAGASTISARHFVTFTPCVFMTKGAACSTVTVFTLTSP